MTETGKRNRRRIRSILAAATVLALLQGPLNLHAAEKDGTDYIVKYREEAAFLLDDSGVPFDVVNRTELKKLLRDDAVEWFEEDGEAVLMEAGLEDHTSADEASVYYNAGEQWNLAMIRADRAFRNGYLGTGMRVGVIDSGVNPHQDFSDRLESGHNYMQEAMENDALADDTTDEYGHGTRVAGLIAAAGEDGYIGAAPGAEIIPLKCTDGKTVKISAICRAIYGGINDYGCDVLNLSLGVQLEYQSLKEAVEFAEEKNVVVVAATGNNGTSALYYPAGYDTVIGVGSVGRDGSVYYHSNHNSSIFLTAPGVDVRSTNSRGGYSESTGCSFAVPQVAAAAAVMLGIDHTLAPSEIMQILSETAVDQGAQGYDESYGYGILNLGGCVKALTGDQDEETDPLQPSDPIKDPDPADPSDEWDPLGGSGSEKNSPEDQASWSRCTGDKNCVLNGFTDLDSKAWYHDGIHYVLEKRIMNGTGEDIFEPLTPTSRGMTVTMLWRMEGSPQSDEKMSFQDVAEGMWYTDAVKWAAANDIVNGYSKDVFAPDEAVSREQLAVILCRFMEWKGIDTGSGDSDPLGHFIDTEQISSWALYSMRWAVSEGIIQGVGSSRIRPDADAVRAQVATMLMRYDLLEK